MESNPEEWHRVTLPKLLDENLNELADFLGAKPNDMAFIESTIRGNAL